MEDYEYNRGYREPNQGQERGGDKSATILGGLVTLDSPSMAATWNNIEDTIKPLVLRNAASWIEKQAPNLVGTKAAGYIANTAVLGGIFYKELVGAGKSFLHYSQGMRKLGEQLSPVLLAGNHNNGVLGLLSTQSRHNQVIERARERLGNKWWCDMLSDAAQLPASATQVYLLYREGGGWKAIAEQGKEVHAQAQQDAHSESAIRGVQNGDIKEMAISGGTSFLSSFLRDKAAKKGNLASKSEIALDMIMHLGSEVNDKPGEAAIDLPNGRATVPIRKYVKDIFNHHMRDMGEKEISRSNQEKIDYACEYIAEEIIARRLNPMMLVELVGERKLVKPDGKIATHAEIRKEVEAKEAKLPVHSAVDASDWLDALGKSEDDVKALLSGPKGEARDFILSIIPPDVLKKIGISEKEGIEANQRVHSHLDRLYRAALKDLASLPDKELKENGFSDQEIEDLREVGLKMQHGRLKSVVAGVGMHGRPLEEIGFMVLKDADLVKSWVNGDVKMGSLDKKPGAKPHPEERDLSEQEQEEAAPRRHHAREWSEREERAGHGRSAAYRTRRELQDEDDLPDTHLMAEGREHRGADYMEEARGYGR